MLQRGIPATTGHPPGIESRRRIPLPAVGLLLAFAVLLGMLLYYAQFSGTIRWLLGVVALAVLAAVAWGQIQRRTAEPSPLIGPRSPGPTRDGELDSFASAVRRASRGLPYSQVLVASRARSAFLERARLALGLPPETIRDVQRDPEALRRMFGDDALVDFLYLEAGDLEDRMAWVQRARARGGFVPAFRDVRLRAQAGRFPPPARAGLHERPPRGRDQPRAAEDPIRAARGDAGTTSHPGGRDVSIGPAVLRDRDAESDRARRHLSAPRGAGRPVPAEDRCRLSDAGAGDRSPRASTEATRRRRDDSGRDDAR